jgi:hypothetical protein
MLNLFGRECMSGGREGLNLEREIKRSGEPINELLSRGTRSIKAIDPDA